MLKTIQDVIKFQVDMGGKCPGLWDFLYVQFLNIWCEIRFPKEIEEVSDKKEIQESVSTKTVMEDFLLRNLWYRSLKDLHYKIKM